MIEIPQAEEHFSGGLFVYPSPLPARPATPLPRAHCAHRDAQRLPTMSAPMHTEPSLDAENALASESESNSHDAPSSPFLSHVESDHDKMAPAGATRDAAGPEATPTTPTKPTDPSRDHRSSETRAPSTATTRKPLQRLDPSLRDNESFSIATKVAQDEHRESHDVRIYESVGRQPIDMEDTDWNPEVTAMTIDDSCFSTFSEMPNLDMTKFAVLRGSPAKGNFLDSVRPWPLRATAIADPCPQTPKAATPATPSTIRRHLQPPSSQTPHRRLDDDGTTNLLLDFTSQMEAFASATHSARARQSPVRSAAEPRLLSHFHNQRSPAKGAGPPSTPADRKSAVNLLDFELPPAPTPRSIPTVTIRELESLKSSFQSQVSSLTASLLGKEAEVKSLALAVSNAERRVGEAQEELRNEHSAREHAELQMEDWKKKGEEVQELLRKVQEDMNRYDEERDHMLRNLEGADRRVEAAEARASDAEARAIEAESKQVDTTTFVASDAEGLGPRYTEVQVQALINEKINDASRDLHAVYKAKHEKKIAALKGNYMKKAEEKNMRLREQIQQLEARVQELQAPKQSPLAEVSLPNLVPAAGAPTRAASTENAQHLKAQQAEMQSQKARLVGLTEEMKALRFEHTNLHRELEAERIEKGELVAAAEQMLALQIELQLQQEELRKGAVRSVNDAAKGGTSIARPTSLRGPGFSASGLGLARSTSAGGKSRIMTNIERMGARGQGYGHGSE